MHVCSIRVMLSSTNKISVLTHTYQIFSSSFLNFPQELHFLWTSVLQDFELRVQLLWTLSIYFYNFYNICNVVIDKQNHSPHPRISDLCFFIFKPSTGITFSVDFSSSRFRAACATPMSIVNILLQLLECIYGIQTFIHPSLYKCSFSYIFSICIWQFYLMFAAGGKNAGFPIKAKESFKA